jgi:hypothetical protein
MTKPRKIMTTVRLRPEIVALRSKLAKHRHCSLIQVVEDAIVLMALAEGVISKKTYRVKWIFEDGKEWEKGGYSHEDAVNAKEYPLRYGLPVRSATMEPEEG